MSPPRPTDRTDMAIGFLAFFGVVFLGITIGCEIAGAPALTWSLVLLGIVVGLALEVRHRARLVRSSTK